MLPTKPLQALIPELIAYIESKQESLVIHNKKLLDIHSGGLLQYIEASLRPELSERAYQRTIGRIPPINILSQVIDKLSKVYVDPASRDAGDNLIDGELLSYYEKELDLDNQLSMANELLNLNKYFALEPYLAPDGYPDLRILPADKFLVWSDYPQDPTIVTVFIKFMGTIKKNVPAVDKRGVVIKGASSVIKDVALFHFYTDAEFMVADSDGEVISLQENPYGRIPFVYCPNSLFDLMPTPDSDNFAMAVLIPKLLTDLNYAVQFMSHSIIYGIDIDPSNLDRNADAFWVINSVEGEGKTPSIGTIKPEVDVDKVLSLINAKVGMWLDSKGLKTGSIGNATTQNSSSGISKMIDNADASASHRKQTILFRRFEANLWSLIKDMHHFWVSNQMLTDKMRDFSIEFKPLISFADSKVIVDTKTVLEELKLMFDMGLVNKKQALTKLYPNMTDEELDQMLADIEADTPNQQDQINAIINSVGQVPPVVPQVEPVKKAE